MTPASSCVVVFNWEIIRLVRSFKRQQRVGVGEGHSFRDDRTDVHVMGMRLRRTRFQKQFGPAKPSALRFIFFERSRIEIGRKIRHARHVFGSISHCSLLSTL